MDKTPVQSWSWLPQQMPGVAKLIAEKRRKLGDAHINECWKRGVVQGLPGCFFAREGSLSVGTPWTDAEFMAFAWMRVTGKEVCLLMADVGAFDAAG